MTAESVSALSVPGERVMTTSVVSGSVPRECVISVPMRTAHRVPRKTKTLTAALSVMPTVMMAAMVTITGPTARRSAAAATRPTVVVMSAMSPVARKCKFRSVPAGKAFAAAPALMRSSIGATKACVTRLPPCESRSLVRAAPAPCAAVWPPEGSAPTPAATGTPRWSPSAPFGSAPPWSARFASLGSGSRLPRDLAIPTVIGAAITTHAAAFTAISPGVARGTLVGRVPPFSSVSLVATSGIAAVHHAFFVSIVVVPANPALLVPLVFTPPVALGTAAIGVARVLTNAPTTSRRSALVRAGIVSVPIVGCVRHFVSSNLAGRIGSPIPLRDKLHDRRRCNSSQKHQRVIAHRHFLDTSNAGRFSESTRSPISKSTRTRALWTFLVRGWELT